MKKKLYMFISAILVICTVLSLSACGEKGKVESLIEDFGKACNVLDLNKMMEYVSPSISKAVEIATGVIGFVTNMDSEEVLDKFAALLTKESGLSGKDFFSSIKIDVKDVAINEDTASAMANISYTIGGEEHTKDATFTCSSIEGKWYISGLKFI